MEVLPTPGGPTSRMMEPRHLALEDAHGEELQDAGLDVVQAVVVAVEDAPGPLQVELVRGVNAPGQQGDPVQVIAGDGVLRRARLEHRHLVHLIGDALLGLLAQLELFQAGLELVQLRGAVVLGQAELFLNRLELLAQ